MSKKNVDDLDDLFMQLITHPAAGINLVESDVSNFLNKKKTKCIKKKFNDFKKFRAYLKNINLKIPNKSLFIVLVDPEKFPNLHSPILGSPICEEMRKKRCYFRIL